MRKQFLTIACMITLLTSISYAQTYPGYRTGNYTGVNGAFFNPANIADNRFQWNINLAAINGFAGTDQGGIKLSDITNNFDANNLKSKILKGHSQVNSLDYADLLGPSFMLSLSPNTSVALTTRSRVFANVKDVNGDLANAIIDPAGAGITTPLALNQGRTITHTTGWTEIGGSVAQVFSKKGSHNFFKGGITLKYIAGTADAYLTTDGITGTLQSVGNTTVIEGPAAGYISINATNTNFTNYKFSDIFKFTGQGFGGDVGFVYEYRPDMDYSMYTNDRWANKYKLKIGVSLLDVGMIKFNKSGNVAANFNTDIPDGSQFDLNALNGKSFGEFIPVFNASPNFVPGTPQNTSYTVNLPTTVQASIDYLFHPNWAVNIAGQFNTNNSINFNLYEFNSYSVTPRWENSLISVELPLNYNDLTQFNAGLAFRIGPFFIGSGSIITALFNNTKQADVHVGLNWGLLYKKKPRPDTDKDGVYDDVDKCPTVYGLPRYDGCPIPDTDNDGINDEQDSCKTVPGVAKYHGCPVPDTDKDGVNDEEDSCVNVPGLAQFHGCPDTDGDGIPDPQDKCPTVPGVAKYQGCPVPDTDGDGVPDHVDACPIQPGPASTHGCPLEKIVVAITADFKNILFDFGKSTIKPESEEIIARAAKIMNTQIPNSSFYVDGFTDNIGNAARNKKLSKARAQAVVNLLIKDGVSKDRLMARGFGNQYPKCTNSTDAGRQCNRRVEVSIRNVNQSQESNSVPVQ